jgi:hypothetical protein
MLSTFSEKKDAGGNGLGIFSSSVVIKRSINKDTKLGTQFELSVTTNTLLQIGHTFIAMQFVSPAVLSLIVHVQN